MESSHSSSAKTMPRVYFEYNVVITAYLEIAEEAKQSTFIHSFLIRFTHLGSFAKMAGQSIREYYASKISARVHNRKDR